MTKCTNFRNVSGGHHWVNAIQSKSSSNDLNWQIVHGPKVRCDRHWVDQLLGTECHSHAICRFDWVVMWRVNEWACSAQQLRLLMMIWWTLFEVTMMTMIVVSSWMLSELKVVQMLLLVQQVVKARRRWRASWYPRVNCVAGYRYGMPEVKLVVKNNPHDGGEWVIKSMWRLSVRWLFERSLKK